MSLEKIQSVVEVYIDSMKEASAEKVKEAFHPNGSVVGHLHGDFLEMSTDDFAGFVSSQEPSDVEFEILSTEKPLEFKISIIAIPIVIIAG